MVDIRVIHTPDLVYDDYIYVGRGTPLANNDKSIDEYADWLYDQLSEGNQEIELILSEAVQLALATGTAILRCYCSEHQCHATIIKDVLEQAIQGQK